MLQADGQASSCTIELQQVTKSYADRGLAGTAAGGRGMALSSLTLGIPRQQTTVVIGPSGCGKSTLLRLANGLLEPDSGQVLVDGQALFAGSPELARQTRQRMGMVIQEGGLFPHLTAGDNVTLQGRILGRPPETLRERMVALCELVQISTDLLERYPAQLSGGQRQRISLLRALMPDPEVLLLDEPLGALDPMIRNELQKDLREIFRQLKKTVILVTHDLHEAVFFADRVVLLNQGRLEQSGSPQELRKQPANDFVRAFVQAQFPVGGGD